MCVRLLSTINFSPVANPNDDDSYGLIVNAGDNAIVADPVFPEVPQLGTFQGLADPTRIIKRRDAVVEKSQDALGCLMTEFVQFPFR